MIYFYTAPKDNDFNEKTEIATTFLKRFRIFNHRYKLNIMKIMHYLEILSTAISIISLIIVIYGAVIAFCAFLRNEARRITGQYSFTATRELRADLGTYLLLGLEFLIASDILKTVLEPGLNELAILGGIVVLRTVLSIFLNKEIRELQAQKETD